MTGPGLRSDAWLPAIIVYLIFQRHLVKGLTLGMGK